MDKDQVVIIILKDHRQVMVEDVKATISKMGFEKERRSIQALGKLPKILGLLMIMKILTSVKSWKIKSPMCHLQSLLNQTSSIMMHLDKVIIDHNKHHSLMSNQMTQELDLEDKSNLQEAVDKNQRHPKILQQTILMISTI